MEKQTKVKAHYRKGKLVRSHNKKIKKNNFLRNAAIGAGVVGIGGLLLRKNIKNYSNFLKHNNKGTLVRYNPDLAKVSNKSNDYIVKNMYGLDYVMKKKYGKDFDLAQQYKNFASIYNDLVNNKKRSSSQAAFETYEKLDDIGKEFIFGLSRIEKKDIAIKEFRNNLFKHLVEDLKNIDPNVGRIKDKYNAVLRASKDPSIGEAERKAYQLQLDKFKKQFDQVDIVGKIKQYGFNNSEIKEYSKANNIELKNNLNLITFARKKGSKDKKKRQSRVLSPMVKRGMIFGAGLGLLNKGISNLGMKEQLKNKSIYRNTVNKLRFIKDNKNKLPLKDRLYAMNFKTKGGKLKLRSKTALGLGLIGGAISGGIQSKILEWMLSPRNKNNK